MWGVAVVLLLAGFAGGYFYGTSVGVKNGLAQADEKAKQQLEVYVQSQEKLAAQAANPFGEAANPLKGVTANPFENVNINPFAQ